MSKSAGQRYLDVLGELRLLRDLTGEELSDEAEEFFVSNLDAYWHEMTDEERREVEQEIIERRASR